MPDENTPSPEYLALLEDLKLYDNPEVFEDVSLPQLYKLRIVNLILPELPTILRTEVDGVVLISALRETIFAILQRTPNIQEIMQEYGDKDWNESRARLIIDAEYLESERMMFWFFVRYFPKLMVHIYNIGAVVSAVSALGQLSTLPSEIEQKETAYRAVLKNLLRGLEKDIKQWLATRSKGRPSKTKSRVDGAPELARQVWKIACEMMGERRGVEAVPALKEIALKLNTSAGALGRRLTRYGWPWTEMKGYLANRT